MSEQEMAVWTSYGIVDRLLEERLKGMEFYFYIETLSRHVYTVPVEEWKVVMASLASRVEYDLNEMVGREKEFADKISLRFLFS